MTILDLTAIEARLIECREAWDSGNGKMVNDVIVNAGLMLTELRRLGYGPYSTDDGAYEVHRHAPDFKDGDCETRDCHLDEGIAEIVYALWDAGVKIHTSCQGGGPANFHAWQERQIHFGSTDDAAGPAALAAAIALDMPINELRKCFQPSNPALFHWTLIFNRFEDWSRANGRAEQR